jgi:hypothetical protein
MVVTVTRGGGLPVLLPYWISDVKAGGGLSKKHNPLYDSFSWRVRAVLTLIPGLYIAEAFMPFLNFRNSALVIMSAFTLAGCGDGWDMQPYEGVPYSMERTAGKGIEYVRASMAQPKGPALQPKMEESVKVMETDKIDSEAPPHDAAPAPVVEPHKSEVNDAAGVFNDKQRK